MPIWAVVMGEICMIKHVRYLPSGAIELHSDNPHVPPFSAGEDDLHIIGCVIAVVRKL